MIKTRMIEAGFADRTIRRVLPTAAKNKNMTRGIADNLSANDDDDAPTGRYQKPANENSMTDL